MRVAPASRVPSDFEVVRRIRALAVVWPVIVASLVLASACGDGPTSPTPAPSPPSTTPPPAPPPPPPPPPPPRLGVDRILAFGDSLTEGESSGVFSPIILPGSHDPSTPGVTSSYPAKLQGLVDARYTDQQIRIFNGGRGGERASDAYPRMLELISQLTPQVIIIMTGVNDLNGGASISTTADAIEELVKGARARGLTVLLSTLPRQVEGGRRAYSIDEVVPYNDTIRRIAAKEAVTLVDIYPHLTDGYITPDGLHITEEGNALLATLYLDAIKVLFETEGTMASRTDRR